MKRPYVNALSFFIVVALLMSGCATRQQTVVTQRHAFLNESLFISAPPRLTAPVVQALRSDQSLNDGGVSVQISAFAPQTATSRVKTMAYIDALTDAQTKAQAIAARLHITLGRVASVAEVSAGSYSSAAEAGTPQKLQSVRPVVSSQADGLTTLAVTYGGSIPIAVYGNSRGMQQFPSAGSAEGVQVSLQGQGTDFAAASAKMQRAEDEVKAVSRRIGGPDAQVTIRSASSNSY